VIPVRRSRSGDGSRERQLHLGRGGSLLTHLPDIWQRAPRKELAEMLALNLWTEMIAGSEMDEETCF
jgi:hypothetical protein